MTNISSPSSSIKNVWARAVLVVVLLMVLILPPWSAHIYGEILRATPLPDPQAQADCGIVLTGGPFRVREGVVLLSRHRIGKLIISGANPNSTLSDMFPEIVYYPEVRFEDVILERRSNSTAGNAQQSAVLAEALACHTSLLITSDYHMFRALKVFRQVFPSTMTLVPYAVHSGRLDRVHFWDSRYWSIVFEEWAKFIFYQAFIF